MDTINTISILEKQLFPKNHQKFAKCECSIAPISHFLRHDYYLLRDMLIIYLLGKYFLQNWFYIVIESKF